MDFLAEIIKKLLTDNHSGGAKLLELIPELYPIIEDKTILTPDNIMESIENCPDLKVLTYYWPMSKTELREKQFIYLNL